MIYATSVAALSFAPAGVVVPGRSVISPRMQIGGEGAFDQKPWTTDEIQDEAGMKELAIKLNPSVGFWDPLGIVGPDTMPETIGWFRHAEIKHGRVAMAAFVGYCVQYNGFYWPWNLQGPLPGGLNADTPVITFADISAAGGPADQWDALPTAAKIQILGFVAFLEGWSEFPENLKNAGTVHYVRGGKPGVFPSFENNPHPVPLNLWDPFGFTKKLSPERKEKALLAEVNNGRLAMIGIFGLISASKGLIVPGLDGLGIKPYAGEIMAPFSSTNSDLTFVPDMLNLVGNLGYKI
jgi:hypothetical protein